ncbi:MAG: hypothetical protein JO044_14555 [Mycobacteriaceae bacterium]|nr:hypothetical protein [Mycobacteriaceae bacterium]
MIKGWRAGTATVVVMLLTLALVVLDLTDGVFRRWWSARAFTTDTLGGILVVLITVLVVNQVLRIRQQRDRSRATAAQAAIVMSQAVRATRAVSALGDSGDRDAAADEVRTYMTMVLIAAPILIDARTPRAFLERAQHLGGELAQILGMPTGRSRRAAAPSTALDQALDKLRAAAAPLLALLSDEDRAAAGSDETEPPESSAQCRDVSGVRRFGYPSQISSVLSTMVPNRPS